LAIEFIYKPFNCGVNSIFEKLSIILAYLSYFFDHSISHFFLSALEAIYGKAVSLRIVKVNYSLSFKNFALLSVSHEDWTKVGI